MKAYALIASGKYTATINGENYTADKLEVIAAFSDEKRAHNMLNDNPDVEEPEKWGVRSISIYEFEVQE